MCDPLRAGPQRYAAWYLAAERSNIATNAGLDEDSEAGCAGLGGGDRIPPGPPATLPR